ncbi:MAG: hypothetical protein AAGH92_07505 [Planctomycetota bacterium]
MLWRESNRRAKGMGSVVAVATLGLCAVALSSVTLLVRMDLERTQTARDVAQAVKLLQAGADAALARVDGLDTTEITNAPDAIPVPDVLAERDEVSLQLRFASGDADQGTDDLWITIEASVGGTIASQRLRITSDAGEWVLADIELGRIYTLR